MRKLLPACALLALLFVPLACDLQKTGNQLAAKKVIVATLLATPPVTISPAAMAGLDGGFDAAGFPADAGFSFDAGNLTVPSQTVAFLYFGTRTTDSLDTPPDPVPNATVSVTPAGGAAIALKNDGSGNYSKTSMEDPSFKYASGKTYEFTATLAGEAFVGEVENAPLLETINQFHPAKGFVDQTTNTAFTFTRPEPPVGQERTLGFVTVMPISDKGDRGEPTYTNVPQTPLGFLKLVALPSEWKTTQVTVPGSAFPQVQKTYLVVFQSVKLGGPKSDNVFTGSAILAGAADVAVVRTK
ncbi:MAG: hypothetical protein ACYC8T_01655 [Myxococcaceae bacterium]